LQSARLAAVPLFGKVEILKAECGKPGQNTDHRIGQPLLALAIDRSGGLV
jgi:hypothetical protein